MKPIKAFSILCCFVAILSCTKKEVENKNDASPLLGIWEIENFYRVIGGNKGEVLKDGRHFALKQDSVMIVYWKYPNSSDQSIWYKKGTVLISKNIYRFFHDICI